MANAERTQEEGLINLREAARRIGCTSRQVQAMIYAGTIHGVDISTKGPSAKRKTWRIRPRELDAFIRSRVLRPNASNTNDDESQAA